MMTPETRLIKVGELVGLYRAKSFDFKHNDISRILIYVGETVIKSIQFEYMENGKYVLSEKYGPKSNIYKFHTVELNHPDEYIKGVYGKYNEKYGEIMVITFTSNIQKYGPFGVTDPDMQKLDDSISFTYNLGKSGEFGGFHGAYTHNCLLFLGLYLKAKTVPPSSRSKIPKREA